MSHGPDLRRRVQSPLTAHSFATVVVASLLVALAIPGLVVLASYPAAGLAFLGGVVLVCGRHRLVAALDAGRQWTAGVQHRYATAER